MARFFTIAVLCASSLTLSGCSVFYPNWGATGLPEPSLTETSIPAQSPTATPTEESSAEATESASSEVEEPAQEVKRTETLVEIIMASPEPDFGVLTVIAQLPKLSESGGKCIFKFIGADVEKTLEVKAEPSSDYTQCFPIEYPLAELPKGNGVVTVSYESEGHFGTSAPVSVVIG